MSLQTYPPLNRISRERLSSLLLDSASSKTSSSKTSSSTTTTTTSNPPSDTPPPTIAIIDVRDSDHIGGHILSSLHRPSTTLSQTLPSLLTELESYDIVVFHCALSQQRGPSAALKYMRAKKEEEKKNKKKGMGSSGEDDVVPAEEGGKKKKEQEILVLDGGFVEWQEKYGDDTRLTEGWSRDVWRGFGGY